MCKFFFGKVIVGSQGRFRGPCEICVVSDFNVHRERLFVVPPFLDVVSMLRGESRANMWHVANSTGSTANSGKRLLTIHTCSIE